MYAVGDYAGGQQYYATATSNFTSSSSSSNGNTNSNSYIVPVDDSILNQSRGSPTLQTISTVSGRNSKLQVKNLIRFHLRTISDNNTQYTFFRFPLFKKQ